MSRLSLLALWLPLLGGGACSDKTALLLRPDGSVGQGGEAQPGAGGMVGGGGGESAGAGGAGGFVGLGGDDIRGGAFGSGGVPGSGGEGIDARGQGGGGGLGKGGALGRGGVGGNGGGPSGGSMSGGQRGGTGGISGSGGASLACECPAGQVYRFHSCLSTLELGCGPSCKNASDCGRRETCDPCAASTTCYTAACLSACAPTELNLDPLEPDSLRISSPFVSPTGGATIGVLGHAWYIGGLMYSIRVGAAVVPPSGGSGCTIRFTAPANPSGLVPVWVSQYGSTTAWVLAGFLRYGGSTADCTQPGYPCATSEDCCSGPDARVLCTAGRCRAD